MAYATYIAFCRATGTTAGTFRVTGNLAAVIVGMHDMASATIMMTVDAIAETLA
jgi:hypothetical protein